MALNPIQSSAPVAAPAASDSNTPRTSASTQSISALGQALAGLQTLHRADPARFKAAAAQISQQLRVQAQQLPTQRALFFEKLATTFDSAAQSGELGPLAQMGVESSPAQGALAVRHYAATQASAERPAPESLAGVIADAVQSAA